jgi:hypothetical protein
MPFENKYEVICIMTEFAKTLLELIVFSNWIESNVKIQQEE